MLPGVLRKIGLVGAGLLLFGLAGCGTDPAQVMDNLINDVKVKTVRENDVDYLQISAMINTFGMKLPSFESPLKLPQSPQEPYGYVGMRDTLTGSKSELYANIDINKALQSQNIDNKLPNGKTIPVGGLGSTPVYAIPIQNTGGKVYIAFAQGIALVGIAFPISEFDQIGSKVGGINIFPKFSFAGIDGVAGIFSGKSAGETGLALFLNAGNLLDENNSSMLASNDGIFVGQSGLGSTSQPTRVYFIESRPRGKKVDKFYEELYKIRQRNRRLHVR
ncbi:MAG: hypothetical protein AB7F43_00980 [Bacteriovoracia bacterium]